ncbi:c-Myc-binding protein-like [Xiphophorus couchianus]|uniref:c-Myc-binding protein-like n=1 Tax=Xiphophorus couchianus TaxID=32473 RepID=UPI001016E551|nr:c-Myc-binding protein-like [Xiphophorus couchianus]
MARRRVSPADREHFRRYLERSGVVDSLTTLFVSLYEQQEKPAQALEYVKERLGAMTLTAPHTQALQQEANDLRQRCECLEEENKDLKAKLQQYEPDAPEDDEPEAPEDGAAAN